MREVTLEQDGRQRLFYVYAPPNLPANPGVVFAFHGGVGGAARFLETNNLTAAAGSNGFLAVYPDAGGERWNDGRADTAGGADDIGFVRAIVARLQQDYGLDPSRVFATGISNGGIFAHRLACDAPELVTAIAPVAANMPKALLDDCRPHEPTPVMMFSGTADPLMPFGGGLPQLSGLLRMAGRSATEQMLSAPDTAQFWASVNGCTAPRSVALPDVSDDGTTVTRIDYGCPDVVLFQIHGGGHAWPGGAVERRIAGPTSRDISATDLMVQFFRSNGL